MYSISQTFFFDTWNTKPYEEGVKKLRNSIPNGDIFSLRHVFFQIHVAQNHWCCAVVFVETKRIRFYDSYRGAGIEFTKAIKKYLEREWNDTKAPTAFQSNDWIIEVPKNVPLQLDGCNCGIFTCAFADAISLGIEDLTFQQTDTERMRKELILELSPMRNNQVQRGP